MQIYDSPESDLKLNDVFEFVGILTFDPELATSKDDNEVMDGFCEDELVCLPPSKVDQSISLYCPLHYIYLCM